MSLLRRCSRSIGALALLACHSDPTTPPPGAIVDRFGGLGAALIATATNVRFETVCGPIRFPQALVPGPQGEVSLSPVLIPMGAGRRGAVALRGVVTGDRLELELRVLSGAADTGSTHYSLRRGQPADFTNLGCAVDA